MTDRGLQFADRGQLDDADRRRLQLLAANWTLIADLAMSDLVLWVPTWNGAGFTAVAHIRPATGPTVLPTDQVGAFVARGRRPILDRAIAQGRIVVRSAQGDREQAIPVSRDGRVIAVIARHQPSRGPLPGSLEDVYQHSADELAAMVVSGAFPDEGEPDAMGAPPRVGDGFIRLTTDGVVEFASPNASSAFHRLGLATALPGVHLASLVLRLARTPGPIDENLAAVASGRVGRGAALENADAAVTIRTVPIIRSGRLTGSLVLVRDVTDLRRQERALISKDATIREIHHRVKNNLATVAALLRMQARRATAPEATEALDDAVRRVGAIAAVHETLARSPGAVVPFDAVIDRIVGLTLDLDAGVQIDRTGSAGDLPSDLAVPLAMAVAELLANAARHGREEADGAARIRVSTEWLGHRLRIEVGDAGPGLPVGFDPSESTGLGVQIVRTLVTNELGGSVSWEPGSPHGTVAAIDLVPAGTPTGT